VAVSVCGAAADVGDGVFDGDGGFFVVGAGGIRGPEELLGADRAGGVEGKCDAGAGGEGDG